MKHATLLKDIVLFFFLQRLLDNVKEYLVLSSSAKAPSRRHLKCYIYKIMLLRSPLIICKIIGSQKIRKIYNYVFMISFYELAFKRNE